LNQTSDEKGIPFRFNQSEIDSSKSVPNVGTVAIQLSPLLVDCAYFSLATVGRQNEARDRVAGGFALMSIGREMVGKVAYEQDSVASHIFSKAFQQR
jgi:hypothetical protein